MYYDIAVLVGWMDDSLSVLTARVEPGLDTIHDEGERNLQLEYKDGQKQKAQSHHHEDEHVQERIDIREAKLRQNSVAGRPARVRDKPQHTLIN